MLSPKNFWQQTVSKPESSFAHLTEEDLETHLNIARYGDFELTEAIRPSYDLQVVPAQGYRHDFYCDSEKGVKVPVLMAAVTRSKLFEVFMALLEPLDATVNVVLETSHARRHGHADLCREHIDMPVLQSVLWEYEDLLCNDGCTGIAILNPAIPRELLFDEHKCLIVYGNALEQFEKILTGLGIVYREKMKFITEAEHIHSSSDSYQRTFGELQTRLGLDHDTDESRSIFKKVERNGYL